MYEGRAVVSDQWSDAGVSICGECSRHVRTTFGLTQPPVCWVSTGDCHDTKITIRANFRDTHFKSGFWLTWINPLNPELNPFCYLLALLAYHFLHVSRIRVKSLTLRLVMPYIYIYDISSLRVKETSRYCWRHWTPPPPWKICRNGSYSGRDSNVRSFGSMPTWPERRLQIRPQ